MAFISAQLRPWQPDRPVSKGATAYHDAVVNASWYADNLSELIDIVGKKIKENDTVVDFGAGTGVSSLFLLKNLKVRFKLWLVDNSPAWLGKAYDVFSGNSDVKCFLLDKVDDRYSTLAETTSKEIADHVISANTIHLIPNLEEVFKGISDALKPRGSFTFQSGNIIRSGRENGILMIDDTIKRVHDIALEIVRTNSKFSKYRKNLDSQIGIESGQRRLVFPEPRQVKFYLETLKAAGFRHEEVRHRLVKVNYKDWLDFLRVKRLQAGILPEIGGKEPSPEEEQDRDELITMASNQLFSELKSQNPFADNNSFTAEWVYITSIKG